MTDNIGVPESEKHLPTYRCQQCKYQEWMGETENCESCEDTSIYDKGGWEAK